jgi:hypothetical protein
MDGPAQVLMCSLEGDQLARRVRAWQEVASRATARHVKDDRVTATYPNDAQLLVELRELIDAEAECCPFLDFRIEERPDRILTELRFPEDMPAPMRALLLEVMGTPERDVLRSTERIRKGCPWPGP